MPDPAPAYAAAPNHLTHNTFPERESSNFADSLSSNAVIINNIAAASFSVRKEKLHKLNKFTEFICYGQKKARIPARATVFRQFGQKPRRTMPRKDPPRHARAQRTGNAGTGPLFLGARTCPFPGAEENSRGEAKAARAHNNEAGPKGSASFMGRKWITARRGRCCRRRSRGRGHPGRRSQDLEGHPGRRNQDPEGHPEDHPEDRPGPAGRPGTSSRTPC